VYAVDDKMLANLDWLENHPKLYVRSPCRCRMLSKEEGVTLKGADSMMDCEMYLLKGFKPELLTLPFRSSYSNFMDESKSYRSRENRDKGYNIIDLVKS